MKEFMINLIKNPIFLYCIVCLLIALLILQAINNFKKTKKLRNDAIKRSKAVIGGQVVEQVAPFLPGFPCNPADAKFLGKPVDFVSFSGLSDKDTVDEILFIEVKTGKSELSKREKEIRKAVEEGRVRYVEYRPSV